jgi:hypothetical protein
VPAFPAVPAPPPPPPFNSAPVLDPKPVPPDFPKEYPEIPLSILLVSTLPDEEVPLAEQAAPPPLDPPFNPDVLVVHVAAQVPPPPPPFATNILPVSAIVLSVPTFPAVTVEGAVAPAPTVNEYVFPAKIL